MIKVMMFGSFYRGFAVLNELLHGPLRDQIQVVAVATDDPSQSFISAPKRVWQYGYTTDESTMVAELAADAGIPVYRDRVKSEEFYDLYENEYKPDLCIMATFGQMIDQKLFSYPRLGFYNLHPSDHDGWPSIYAGPNPFRMMLDDHRESCVVSIHEVDGDFDTGSRIGVSETVYIPPGVEPRDLHKMTSTVAALLVREQIINIIEKDSSTSRGGSTDV